jgi:hypothetical protein
VLSPRSVCFSFQEDGHGESAFGMKIPDSSNRDIAKLEWYG